MKKPIQSKIHRGMQQFFGCKYTKIYTPQGYTVAMFYIKTDYNLLVKHNMSGEVTLPV